MPDPTALEVAKKVEARLRKLRRVDDIEELLQTVLASYREVLRAWPWGFALQRYRTLLKGASKAQVTLTSGQVTVTLVSGEADWSMRPSILLPGRRPLFTDGGGNLLDPWMGSSGTYDATIGYNTIPLFDVQVWGIAVTNVGPLAKMSHLALETVDPNRSRIAPPQAFIPYTPYVEIWPVPDRDYDVDVWMVPMPESNLDPSQTIAAPLEDAVIYKSMEHLLTYVKADLVPYYSALTEKVLKDIRDSDVLSFSWPEFHQVFEAATRPLDVAFRIVLP